MVQAIGGGSSSTSGVVRAAALDAQLARYQQQLSECVNCASAKTARGKADIDAISSRISSIRQRIEEVAGNGSVQPVATATPAARSGGGTIDVYA